MEKDSGYERDYSNRTSSRTWFTVIVITLVLIAGAIAYSLVNNPTPTEVVPGVGGGPGEIPTLSPTETPVPSPTVVPSPIP